MKIECDLNKNPSNIKEHGIDFELVRLFDFFTAQFSLDNRHDYGEVRYRALGFIECWLHALTFVYRGEVMRVISLRKANKREIKYYEQIKQDQF